MKTDEAMAQNALEAENLTESQGQTPSEVRPSRRRFTQAEKVAILEELDSRRRGSKGLYLRQKGLSSSVVYSWRSALQLGAGLEPKSRGRKARDSGNAALEIASLRRQLIRAQETNRQMQIIIDVQKKVSQILGVTLPEIAQ